MIGRLLNFLAKRIVIDTYPTNFIFSCKRGDIHISVAATAFIACSSPESEIVSIGKMVSDPYFSDPGVLCINIFDTGIPLPANCTLSREQLINALFEFGIASVYQHDFFSPPVPIITITGISRFDNLLPNAKIVFEDASFRAGASEVLFDGGNL